MSIRELYPWRDGVSVTSERFVAHGRSFAIRELRDPKWGPGSVAARRAVTGQIIAVETALAIGIVLLAPALVACAAGGLYLLAMGASVTLTSRQWPTPLHLWATYRGRPTLLYTSTNATQFHQVARALRRAFEDNRGVPR